MKRAGGVVSSPAMRRAILALSLLVPLGLWLGCGSAAGDDPSDAGAGGSTSAAGAGGFGAAGAAGDGGASGGTGGFDPQGGAGGQTSSGPNHLLGKVYAPNGTIPISGALVYLSPYPPEPIPDHVYCDKCVQLGEAIPFTTTAPDGSFDLGVSSSEGYLVVQKGAFRRVRKVENLVAGKQDVPKALTTMPPKTDKAQGDDVPKIAVVLGAWDPIELVLARMGLSAKITKDAFGKPRVLGKDADSFAIYGLHDLGEKSPYPGAQVLISTPAEIEKYHIVFIPCSGSSDLEATPKCSGVFASGSAVANTLTGFVQKGGRLYASDWSYEYVRQLFKGFVSWKGEGPMIGSACNPGGGDEAATATDPGLAAWLTAQGQPLTTVKDAWTHIDHVSPTASKDADGNPVTETPKVWVAAGGSPANTSFKFGCGRVLYSTYHTQPSSETDLALEPQALSLLYTILEVGVCIDQKLPG